MASRERLRICIYLHTKNQEYENTATFAVLVLSSEIKCDGLNRSITGIFLIDNVPNKCPFGKTHIRVVWRWRGLVAGDVCFVGFAMVKDGV